MTSQILNAIPRRGAAFARAGLGPCAAVGLLVALACATAAPGCRSAEPAAEPEASRVEAADPMTDEPGAAMATDDVERVRLKQRRAPSTRPPELERRSAYDQPRVRP